MNLNCGLGDFNNSRVCSVARKALVNHLYLPDAAQDMTVSVQCNGSTEEMYY